MENSNAKGSTFQSQSQKVVSNALCLIDDELWQKIAEKNVIKMAPLNMQQETNKMLESIGMIGENDGNIGKKKFAIIKKQNDPLPAIGDKLKQGVIRIQTKFRNNTDSSDVPDGINNMTNSSKFFRKSMQKPKVVSSAIRSNTQQSINSVNKKVDGSKFKSLITQSYQQVSVQQNRLWRAYTDELKTRKEEQTAKKIRLKQIEEHTTKNLKRFKELKKVTFDYEGKFFGTGIATGQSKLMSLKSKFTTDSVSKKPMKENQESVNPFTPRIIVNSRVKQRNKIMIQQKNTYEESIQMYEKLKTCTGIMNTFANDQQISEGVTIKENQTVMSKPWKGSDSNMSRNMKLSEFRGMTKDRNFKDYSTIRAKTLQTLQNSRRATELKVKTPIYQNLKADSKQNRNQYLTANKLRSEPGLTTSIENQIRFKSSANISQKVRILSQDSFISEQKRKIKHKTNSILNGQASLASIAKGRQVGSIYVQNQQLYSSIVDDQFVY